MLWQPIVDVFAMAHGDDENGDLLALDPTDDAVVADAIAPEACQWPSQTLAERLGVVGSRDSMLEVVQDLALNWAVEAS
jgi:hypothetical protein